ncbi:MAG TPA: GNAT family N-acetyltransferase [Rhodanobacter sp.]|jgi:GNAT superfamily N-acetyltransferase|nr:GNAT family N-acetyltransferase [Rhodanobacter sp.]
MTEPLHDEARPLLRAAANLAADFLDARRDSPVSGDESTAAVAVGGIVKTGASACVVRRVSRRDLATLVVMCGEHAQYERAPHEPAGMAERLARALFATPPLLHAWVAEAHGELLGYATATVEFSTWQAHEFLHMDCLFVREGRRGDGIGASLLAAVVAAARRAGCTEIQWQTPDWNTDAARFYRRAGAIEKPKRRFFLQVDG